MSIPYRFATARARRSGGLPTCQSPVPAESTSTSRPIRTTSARKAASARGERQILPRQTNSTAGFRGTIYDPLSTEHNREGIQVGTAIATLIRKPDHASTAAVQFRQLWGRALRSELFSLW